MPKLTKERQFYYWFKYTINGKPHYISLKLQKREAEEIVAHLITMGEQLLKFRHKTC